MIISALTNQRFFLNKNPLGLQVLSAHPTRLLYRCSVCVCSGDAWIMYHAVFNRVLAKDVHCSLGSLLSLALFTLQCCSSLFLRDQFMDSHHVRSVRYDFCIPLRVLHYFKLLICTLGTDVNIKKIVYCYKHGVSVWVFFFFLELGNESFKCLSVANYSNVLL